MINFSDPPSGSADVECQLLEAAKAGDSEQVQRLLTSYPQIVNCRDLDGRWVLMVPCMLKQVIQTKTYIRKTEGCIAGKMLWTV